MRPLVLRLVLTASFLGLPGLVAAQNNPALTVTNVADSGTGSLRWAVGEANRLAGANTIVFDPVVFVPGSPIWLTSGQLTLTDTTGKTTIDGRGASVTVTVTNPSRVFLVGVGVQAEISGLTITGTHAVYDFSDYTTGNGGAIYNIGDLTVSGCLLSSDVADKEGGAIYNNTGARLTVSGSTFSHNSAAFGGGIGSRGELAVSASNFSYNSATGSGSGGGGIGNAAGVATVSLSTLSHNSAPSGTGGGIYNSGGLTVGASTFMSNSARNGGGISSVGLSVTVSTSTFSGNSATDFLGGGGIYNGSGSLTVSESTVAYNVAPKGSGGIVGYSAVPAALHNTLVTGNVLNNVYPPSPRDLDGTFDPASSYNLIGDGSGGLDPSLGNMLGTSSTPIDPKLGPLQNNGGPSWTHALLADSPAINAGDPAILPAPELYDQRGSSFARVVGGRIDIGAFEVQPLTSQQHLANVADVVRALADRLPPGVRESIVAKVDTARDLLDRGNTTPVVKMLEAFIKEVGGLRTAGKLTDAEAGFLIDAARRAIDVVTLVGRASRPGP